MVEVTAVEIVDFRRHRLRVTFSDGKICDVDLAERLRTGGPIFAALLENPELFGQVRVDPDAGTIVWPNGADLAPHVLYGDLFVAAARR